MVQTTNLNCLIKLTNGANSNATVKVPERIRVNCTNVECGQVCPRAGTQQLHKDALLARVFKYCIRNLKRLMETPSTYLVNLIPNWFFMIYFILEVERSVSHQIFFPVLQRFFTNQLC